MKRKKLWSIILFFVVIISGCSNTKQIDISQQDALIQNYEESNEDSSKIKMEEYQMSLPEKANMNTFFVFGNTIYYAVGYNNYFEGATEDSQRIFEKQYNTQIKSVNMETNEEKTLYTYDEQNCVEVTDMQCNGKVLVWEDYGVDSESWSIKMLDLEKEMYVETIETYTQENGDFSTVTLSITDEDLLWYNINEEENVMNPNMLWRYNFEEEETSLQKDNLDTASPYEHMNSINGIYTTYQYIDENTSDIQIYDTKKDTNIILRVKGLVSAPICDGKICVWMCGYDYNNRNEIYIYNLKSKEFEKIECKYVFSFGLVNNCLILNREDGLWLYDIIEKKSKCLIQGDGIVCGYTFETFEGNVYMDNYIGNEGEKTIYSLYEN